MQTQETSHKYDDGELKSALQKYIRRGMAEKAVRTALMLLSQGNGLYRRLPTIAAEDGDWSWGGPVFSICKQLMEDRDYGEDIRPKVCKVVRALAKAAKNHDALAIWGMARFRNETTVPMPDMSMDAMQRFLEGRDWEAAVRVAEGAADQGRRAEVWCRLVHLSRVFGGNVASNVAGLRARARQGLMPSDEGLFACCAMLVIGHYAPWRPLQWETEDATVPESPYFAIDWWAYDMHTRVGKSAMSALVKQGMNREKLLWTWWYAESSMVSQDLGSLYALEVTERGFGNANRIWKEWRPVVKRAVESAMENAGRPVPAEESIM